MFEYISSLFRQSGDRELRHDNVLIYVFKEEYLAMMAEARKYPNRETGGDLFGSFTHGNMPIVWLTTGPGPKAKGSSVEFEQDPKFRTEWQNFLSANYGIQYIGSWHSHHKLNLSRPSGGDMKAAQDYLRRHKRSFTIEVIANHEDGETILRPYFYSVFINQWVLADFKVMEQENPIRSQISFPQTGLEIGLVEKKVRIKQSPEENNVSELKNSKISGWDKNHHEEYFGTDNVIQDQGFPSDSRPVIELDSGLGTTEQLGYANKINKKNEGRKVKINAESKTYPDVEDVRSSQLPEQIALQLVDLIKYEDPEVQLRGKMYMIIVKVDHHNSIAFATDIQDSQINFHQINLISQAQKQPVSKSIDKFLLENHVIERTDYGYRNVSMI